MEDRELYAWWFAWSLRNNFDPWTAQILDEPGAEPRKGTRKEVLKFLRSPQDWRISEPPGRGEGLEMLMQAKDKPGTPAKVLKFIKPLSAKP